MLMAVILLLVSLGFVLAEVFFPSFGLFGLIAGVCILFADILAFEEGQAVGWTFVAAEVVLVPLVVWAGFQVLPKLPFGRRMILDGPVTAPGAGTPQHSHLVGQTGTALTALRPAGLARIGEQRLSVVALGGLIEQDTPITVVSVEGTEIRVRPPDDSPVRTAHPDAGSA